MIALVRTARAFTFPTMLVTVLTALHAQTPVTEVSLKVSREIAPPGAIAQMKVFVTEPKPITSGRASFSFDGFSDVDGIALASGAAGIAVVRGGQIALSILSATGTFGMDSDYPVLTVAGRVPATAPIGQRIGMTIDPGALQLMDPGGLVYPVEIKNGFLQSGGVLSVGDVVPGSADVVAGDVVSIFGTGFLPDTRVRLKETALAGVRYISPNRIDVVLAEPTHMHGKAIRVRNRDGAEVKYFSYQRTRPSGATAHPVLQHVVPVFPDSGSVQHSIDISAATAGLALQNLDATDTFVFAELADASGLPLAAGYIEIPSNTYVVRSLAEIFNQIPPGSGVVTLAGATPLQVLGVDVDAQGRATPRLPR